MTTKLNINIGPFFYFKHCILLLDGCKFTEIKGRQSINLPSGTFLLQVRLLPKYYSNTLLVGPEDAGKTLSVKGIKFQLTLFVTLALSILTYFLTDLVYLFAPIVVVSALLFIQHLYYYHHPDKALRISISKKSSTPHRNTMSQVSTDLPK